MALARKGEILIRRGARLLDEAMQRDETTLAEAYQHPGDPAAGKLRTDFPKPLPHRPTQGHANRPPPLNAHQVFANHRPINRFEIFQPLPNGLSATATPKKFQCDTWKQWADHERLPLKCTSKGTHKQGQMEIQESSRAEHPIKYILLYFVDLGCMNSRTIRCECCKSGSVPLNPASGFPR